MAYLKAFGHQPLFDAELFGHAIMKRIEDVFSPFIGWPEHGQQHAEGA